MSSSKQYDMQIKLLTIGNSAVGKTCLLLRYGQDTFSPTFITTIGIDFKVKYINLDGTKIKLQIWDTAGQERFRTITTSYFRGAQGILLVYDVTDRESFDSVENWVGEIKRNADKSVSIILIGNKCDKEEDRAVSQQEGAALAEKFDIPFFETSAKTNQNVSAAFEKLAGIVKERLERSGAASAPAGSNQRVNFSSNDTKRGGCCK